MSSAYSLLIFDLDGTLIDSAPDLRIAVNRLLADEGLGPLALAQIRSMIGDGASQLVTRAFAAHSKSPADATTALRRFFDYYSEDPTANTVMYPGVEATLRELARRRLTLTVCTNKPARMMTQCLERLGLAGYFSMAVGGDTYAFKKPDARMLTEIMMRERATKERTLMIGDSEVDAATAAAAGVDFALVTYGYRRGEPESIPSCARCTDFAQILEFITPTPHGVPA